MTAQPEGQAEGRISFDPTGRDRPTMTLSPDLAAAVLAELWSASPDRFGNLVKRGMIRLFAPGPNGHPNGGPR